jgi:hypothetical protein
MHSWTFHHPRPAWQLLPAAAIIAAASLTAPAPAQLGQAAGIAKSTTPEYFRRDVLIFAEGLDLDDGQRLIVEGLFEDYIDDFDEGFAGVQQRLENLRPELQAGDERRVMKLVFEPFLDWFNEYDRIGEQFLENVRTVLNEQQLQQWPEFRRRLRREKTMGEGLLAGEKLNLFVHLRDLHLDQEISRQIQPVVEEYDLALDAALQQRNASLKRGRAIMIESIQEQEHNRSLQIMRDQIQYRVQVRDVNLLYLDQLAESLPTTPGTELRANALAKAFPQIYRPQPVERMFKAALRLEDIDPDVLASLESLFAAYQAELDGVNQIIFEGVKQQDPRMAIGRAEAFAARMRGDRVERPTDASRKLFEQRDDLGFTYMGLLNDILTEEQFAALPGAGRWYQREKRGTGEQIRSAAQQNNRPNTRKAPARRGTKPNERRQTPGRSGPAAGSRGGGSSRR